MQQGLLEGMDRNASYSNTDKRRTSKLEGICDRTTLLEISILDARGLAGSVVLGLYLGLTGCEERLYQCRMYAMEVVSQAEQVTRF